MTITQFSILNEPLSEPQVCFPLLALELPAAGSAQLRPGVCGCASLEFPEGAGSGWDAATERKTALATLPGLATLAIFAKKLAGPRFKNNGTARSLGGTFP
ncbi:MAG: hypothetical protein ABSF95_16960 [Verrucomicrobiota bacterium]|jgi:hypothetical protein